MTRWALVTGAGHRIGRQIALELAAAGWNIAVHYHNSEKEAQETAKQVKALKRKAHPVKANLAIRKQAEELVPAIVAETGPLAALVNNASLFKPDAKLQGGGDVRMINLEAPLLLAEAFRKQLPKGRKGAIVNILDGSRPEAGFTTYTDSKKSLRVTTIEMARRMAPDIRVNGVAPGPTLIGPGQSAEHFKRLIEDTLLRSEIPPESIAGAVRFLVDTAGITGEILHIDGGIRLQNTPSMHRALAS
ncbi:MAG: SDR family NAD(P)-dependent oxidoreductase [Bdellovibrionales bacterium]